MSGNRPIKGHKSGSGPSKGHGTGVGPSKGRKSGSRPSRGHRGEGHGPSYGHKGGQGPSKKNSSDDDNDLDDDNYVEHNKYSGDDKHSGDDEKVSGTSGDDVWYPSNGGDEHQGKSRTEDSGKNDAGVPSNETDYSYIAKKAKSNPNRSNKKSHGTKSPRIEKVPRSDKGKKSKAPRSKKRN
jgi:hypothetical protein